MSRSGETGIVAVVQARMGSTRLPGKVLEPIAGKPMLARVVERTRGSRLIERVVVATTDRPGDDAIVAQCERLDVPSFRGDEEDVLDRYCGAAHAHSARVIVRITSDCPLMDPEVVDKVVGEFLRLKPDYASNTIERSYPLGLDCEVMTIAALDRARGEAREPHQRVHVTPYLYENPERFRLVSVRNEQDLSRFRWTVDTPEDLELVRAVYDRLGEGGTFSWREVLELMDREPDLARINRHIRQKTLKEG